MFEIRKGDLFQSGCEAVVNAVNTVGAMGAGLAAVFKRRYPKMFVEYQQYCNDGRLKPGTMHVWKEPDGIYVINFPTKVDWKDASEYSYIDQGLSALDNAVKSNEIKSVALPALGCGLGGLKWERVLDIIQRHHDLRWKEILVAVYEPHESFWSGKKPGGCPKPKENTDDIVCGRIFKPDDVSQEEWDALLKECEKKVGKENK